MTQYRYLVIGLGSLGHNICKHLQSAPSYATNNKLQAISVQWTSPKSVVCSPTIELQYDSDELLGRLTNQSSRINTWLDVEYWKKQYFTTSPPRPISRLGWFNALQSGRQSELYTTWEKSLRELSNEKSKYNKIITIIVGDLSDTFASSLFVDAISLTRHVLKSINSALVADVWAFTQLPDRNTDFDSKHNAYAALRELKRWANNGFYSEISYPLYHSGVSNNALKIDVTGAIFDKWFTFESDNRNAAADLINTTINALLNDSPIQENIINSQANEVATVSTSVKTLGIHTLDLPFDILLKQFAHKHTKSALNRYLHRPCNTDDIHKRILVLLGTRYQLLEGHIATPRNKRRNFLDKNDTWDLARKLENLLFKGIQGHQSLYDHIKNRYIEQTTDVEIYDKNLQRYLGNIIDITQDPPDWDLNESEAFNIVLASSREHQDWFIKSLKEELTKKLAEGYSPKYYLTYVNQMRKIFENELQDDELQDWEELDSWLPNQIKTQYRIYQRALSTSLSNQKRRVFGIFPKQNNDTREAFVEAAKNLTGSILSLIYVRVIRHILEDYISYCVALEETFKTFSSSFDQFQKYMEGNPLQQTFHSTSHRTFVLDTVESKWFTSNINHELDKISQYFEWKILFDAGTNAWTVDPKCKEKTWITAPQDNESYQEQITYLCELVEANLAKPGYETTITNYMKAPSNQRMLESWIKNLNTAHKPSIRLQQAQEYHKRSNYIFRYRHPDAPSTYIEDDIVPAIEEHSITNQITLVATQDALRVTHFMVLENLDLATDVQAYVEAKDAYERTSDRHQYHVFGPEHYASQLDVPRQKIWSPNEIFFLTDWQDVFQFWVSFHIGLIEKNIDPQNNTLYYQIRASDYIWQITPFNTTPNLQTALRAYLGNIHYTMNQYDRLETADYIRSNLQTQINARISTIYESPQYPDILLSHGITNHKICREILAQLVFYSDILNAIDSGMELYQLQRAMFERRIHQLETEAKTCISRFTI